MEIEESRYTPKEYAKLKKVTARTVLNWIKNKLVNVEKLPNGRFLIIE